MIGHDSAGNRAGGSPAAGRRSLSTGGVLAVCGDDPGLDEPTPILSWWNHALIPSPLHIPADAFLRRTNQLWKLVVGAIVLPPIPLVGLGLWSLSRIRPGQPAVEMILSIGGLVLGALVILWLLASVRCPWCRARLLPEPFRSKDGLGAVTRLHGSRTCPACA